MLRKRGKVWWVRLKRNGKLIERSTGASNKEVARKIELEILTKIAQGRWYEKDPSEITLFKDAWERYMREEAKYKSEGTYSRAIQSAKNFLPIIGDLTLSKVTPSVLSAYKVKRLEDRVKMATVIKELQFIRRVFSLCKREWQLIKQSPYEFFRMPSVNDQRVRFLERGQWEQLLNACPSWLRPIVILARFTGMRRGNALNLTWSQIDLQDRVIHLEHTKNGQRLTIPLTETPYNVLVALKNAKVRHLCPFVFHQDGKPYSPYQVSVAFKRACKRAGIGNFRLHDLRHDFASNLIQKGNDLYIVQHLLGHKDGRMTQRYAHLRVENLRQAVESLDRGDKIVDSVDEREALCAVSP
jgi:integrase